MTENLALAGLPSQPLPRPRPVVLAVLALVAALLLLQVEGLAPRLLSRGAAASAPGTGVTTAPADAQAAAEAARASRIGPAAEPGVLEARDPGYRARFDANGFSYLPAGATAPLRVDLAEVAVGARAVDLDLGSWAADGSVLERRVAPALTERVTARDGQVEWDVVLDHALPGSGDLVVRGDLSGTAGQPVVRDGAVQVPLDGASVPVGEVVVKDADGRVLHRGLPEVTGDAIRLVVPGAALDGAHYPVTVDPSVGERKTLAAAGNKFEPAMAYSGASNATHLVVWQQFVAGQYDIYGAVISDDGVGTTGPRQLSFATTGDFRPDVAWSGDNFLVVFEEQYPPNASDVDIRGQRVDKNGTLVGGTIGIATTADGQGDPAITGTSSGFSIAWDDNRNGNWDIYAGRYTPAGVAQDGQGKRLSNDEEPFLDEEFKPDVAWNGQSTIVVWQAQRDGDADIETVQLYQDGQVQIQHNGEFGFNHVLQNASVTSDGTGWLVVYEDKDRSTNAVDLYGFVLDSNNFHDPKFPISQAAGNESTPSVAYSGTTYLVVLTDRRFVNDPDVRARRVGRDGALLESDSFIVEGSTNPAENDMPTVSAGRESGWAVGYEYGTGPQTAIVWRHVSK